MSVRVVTPPAPVVTLEEAKQHLIVDHDDDNSYIQVLTDAATAWLDGPSGWLGRALGVQTLELVTDRFGDGCRDWIELAFPPFIDVVSVKYIDRDGIETVMPADGYELALGQLRPSYGGSWPSPRCQSDAVRIQYRAGYGVAPDYEINAAPDPVRVSILMLVAQWYRTREPVAIGANVEQLPFAVEALLSPFRVFR